jgi:hypothetical protein
MCYLGLCLLSFVRLTLFYASAFQTALFYHTSSVENNYFRVTPASEHAVCDLE